MFNINILKDLIKNQKKMNNHKFLQRMFKAYYKEKKKSIPPVSSITHREFGFIPWNKQIMIRHMGFKDSEEVKNYLIKMAPRHAYSSGSLYLMPDNTKMNRKEYQGCDLIVDIDVDHFYTPCKEDHDIWYCNGCQSSGKGMISECPKCGSLQFSTLNWICEECLETAKNEIIKLIDDFLVLDFNIDLEEIKIAFSGHRGYHLKIENQKIRTLNSHERREIADYLTGNNISFEILGLQKTGSNIYGLIGKNLDWSHKIIRKIEELLKTSSDEQIKELMLRWNFNKNVVKSFINSRKDFLYTITHESHNLWNIEGFGMKNWKKLLRGIVRQIGVEIDEPVTIDIHRLIRYPGSLHGKTGFKVQELSLDQLNDFKPLDENKEQLNPIVFESKRNMQKIKITEREVPQTKILGDQYGPYLKDEIIEVPNHVGVFLLCKEVAVPI
jgi:DNA primase small subunit